MSNDTKRKDRDVHKINAASEGATGCLGCFSIGLIFLQNPFAILIFVT